MAQLWRDDIDALVQRVSVGSALRSVVASPPELDAAAVPLPAVAILTLRASVDVTEIVTAVVLAEAARFAAATAMPAMAELEAAYATLAALTAVLSASTQPT